MFIIIEIIQSLPCIDIYEEAFGQREAECKMYCHGNLEINVKCDLIIIIQM